MNVGQSSLEYPPVRWDRVMTSEDFIHTFQVTLKRGFREACERGFRGRPRNSKISGNFRETSVTSISLQVSYVLSEIMTRSHQTGGFGVEFTM